MKTAAAILFLLLALAQTFSQWLIVLDFAWNRDYLAKNLCENRSRPMLKCGGKCQLAKRLAAEERPDPATPSGKIKLPETLFTFQAPELLPPASEIRLPAYTPHSPAETGINPPADIFHPPAAA